MVREVKERTGWEQIDEVQITGDHRGRECIALSQKGAFSFFIRFNSQGGIETFQQK